MCRSPDREAVKLQKGRSVRLKFESAHTSRSYPSIPFTTYELRNPSHDAPELHKIRCFPDAEALKLWESPSGREIHEPFLGISSSDQLKTWFEHKVIHFYVLEFQEQKTVQADRYDIWTFFYLLAVRATISGVLDMKSGML